VIHTAYIHDFSQLDRAAKTERRAVEALTQQRLGGRPTHPGLIEDLEAGHFERATAIAS
jgi:hypothetical protein